MQKLRDVLVIFTCVVVSVYCIVMFFGVPLHPMPTSMENATARSKQYDELLSAQVKRSNEAEAMIERGKKNMDTQEELQKRFAQVLSVWEAQQQQYQKYLASLPNTQSKEAR